MKPEAFSVTAVPSISEVIVTSLVSGAPYHQLRSTAPDMPGTVPELVYCQSV